MVDGGTSSQSGSQVVRYLSHRQLANCTDTVRYLGTPRNRKMRNKSQSGGWCRVCTGLPVIPFYSYSNRVTANATRQWNGQKHLTLVATTTTHSLTHSLTFVCPLSSHHLFCIPISHIRTSSTSNRMLMSEEGCCLVNGKQRGGGGVGQRKHRMPTWIPNTGTRVRPNPI